MKICDFGGLVNQVLIRTCANFSLLKPAKAEAMDVIDPGRMIFGLLFTIGLMLLLWAVARKYAPGMVRNVSTGQKRLQIIEALQLDAKRRLVVVRDGAAEHLILLGATTENIIETRKYIAPAPEREAGS